MNLIQALCNALRRKISVADIAAMTLVCKSRPEPWTGSFSEVYRDNAGNLYALHGSTRMGKQVIHRITPTTAALFAEYVAASNALAMNNQDNSLQTPWRVEFTRYNGQAINFNVYSRTGKLVVESGPGWKPEELERIGNLISGAPVIAAEPHDTNPPCSEGLPTEEPEHDPTDYIL